MIALINYHPSSASVCAVAPTIESAQTKQALVTG
jgi:hypothetical protein